MITKSAPDFHTTTIGRRTILCTIEDLETENRKEQYVSEQLRAAPSFPALLKAYHRFRRDLNKYDYDPEWIMSRPWELLTAHAGVMSAKSARAQTMRRLATALFMETGLPRRALGGFRGSDGLDWDRVMLPTA